MMKYAVPVCDEKIFNHYSKAPQFLVIDDTTRQSIQVEIEQTTNTNSCGKKHKIMSMLKQHKVEGVIVKNIGKAMLCSLFQQNIKVFTTVRGMDIENLNFNQLIAIEDLSYARPSINKAGKQHQCCSGEHHQDCKQQKLSPKRNRLGVKALSKLQRIHKLQ